VAISNRYEPKGPPSFARARFDLDADEVRELDTALFSPLGDFGRLGLGVGVLGRSSPYLGANGGVFQPIPTITWNAGPFQLLGPNLRVGLVGDDRLRLAATASYRIGFYDEDDSPALAGLGDREDTVMAGLAVVAELPAFVDLELGYEHDALDQIGGGAAQLRASRSFAWGLARLTPRLQINWTSAELSDYDFGVPQDAATAERPAYDVGDTLNMEAGLSSFLELSEDWRVILDMSVEWLDTSISGSPIVDEDYVIKGFLAISYVF
jgi:outer membrane protein